MTAPIRKRARLVAVLTLLGAWLVGAARVVAAPEVSADLVVYGGTAAGVMAAVQARCMGRSVVVVAPELHLGGLSSGGLGFTDTGASR